MDEVIALSITLLKFKLLAKDFPDKPLNYFRTTFLFVAVGFFYAREFVYVTNYQNSCIEYRFKIKFAGLY